MIMRSILEFRSCVIIDAMMAAPAPAMISVPGSNEQVRMSCLVSLFKVTFGAAQHRQDSDSARAPDLTLLTLHVIQYVHHVEPLTVLQLRVVTAPTAVPPCTGCAA